MTNLQNILRQHGPLLSGDILRIMEEAEPDANPAALRKRLNRLASGMHRVFGFFTDNQAFYYLEEQKYTEVFFESLREAINKAAKRIDAILSALEFQKGYLDKDHVAAYSFSPIEKLKGHKLIGAYLEQLEQFTIIRQEDGRYLLSDKFSMTTGANFNLYKAEETARSLVLRQFMNWARTIGLISYNTGTFYSNFGKFQWCFTSPAYVNGLREYRDNQVMPFFVLADVLIGGQLQERHVRFFIEKVKILNAQKGMSRFMPFLIVDAVESAAFALLKENGIIVAFVDQLFGREYAELLRALVNTITNAGAILKNNPDDYLQLLSKIDRLVDGKTNNLRGDLFELSVGYYHGRSGNIDLGRRINPNGERKEIDVFANYPGEIYAAECKGYKAKLSLAAVDEWLAKVAVIRKWLDTVEPYREKPFTAELWSTGGFADDALDKLKKVSKSVKKYRVAYYDARQIIQKFKDIGAGRIVESLNQYFFSEPL